MVVLSTRFNVAVLVISGLIVLTFVGSFVLVMWGPDNDKAEALLGVCSHAFTGAVGSLIGLVTGKVTG